MQKIFFKKMSGAGNDFILFDKSQNPELKLTPEKIKNICNRKNGIGADGVITIEDIENYNYKMMYYNADGSTGSLCGNGARCSIWFAEKTSRLKNGLAKFISNDTEYFGEVLDDELIKFNLNPPKKIKYNFKVKASGQLITSNFADTGSPHVVIKISDVLKNVNNPKSAFTNILEFPVNALGKEIRYSADFRPDGTNVNFVDVIDNVIHIRTYERGVEDETLACGTGSVAAAIICYITDNLKPPVTLKTYGGDYLTVDFEIENQKVKNLSLTGPAKIIFEGSLDEKLFI
ncbi:MAG TPA: diaminopimelate epimerase [Ignavibacteriales bacterium]|nr:diaminopimelate epimerase [Ignavibacteriales bacterium]